MMKRERMVRLMSQDKLWQEQVRRSLNSQKGTVSLAELIEHMDRVIGRDNRDQLLILHGWKEIRSELVQAL